MPQLNDIISSHARSAIAEGDFGREYLQLLAIADPIKMLELALRHSLQPTHNGLPPSPLSAINDWCSASGPSRWLANSSARGKVAHTGIQSPAERTNAARLELSEFDREVSQRLEAKVREQTGSPTKEREVYNAQTEGEEQDTAESALGRAVLDFDETKRRAAVVKQQALQHRYDAMIGRLATAEAKREQLAEAARRVDEEIVDLKAERMSLKGLLSSAQAALLASSPPRLERDAVDHQLAVGEGQAENHARAWIRTQDPAARPGWCVHPPRRCSTLPRESHSGRRFVHG